MRTFLLSTIAAALLLAPATLSASTVVYDNGPINGTINAWSIATSLAGWEVSDSFTLTAPATLTSADVGLWVNPGDTPSSLTWYLGTSFFDGSLGSGTETPSNTYWGLGFGAYPIYDSTFSLPSITLGPGTYYLSLSGMTTEDQNIFWDETDGPSSAYELNYGAIGSESFRLYSGTAIPEPASLGLIGMGLLGMAAVLRRRVAR
jgi:hypothetical protein